MTECNPTAVSALERSLRLFDPRTAEHAESTAAFAEQVGVQMGFDAVTIERCRIGGLLHDVGMLSINKAILEYAGMLDEQAWTTVEQHCISGAQMLASIPTLEAIAPIVRAHHERVDGSGYPDRLAGEEIPIEARVVAVVDAFHTMSVPHLYRQVFNSDLAFTELVGNTGSQFDDQVVDAFLEVMGRKKRHLRSA